MLGPRGDGNCGLNFGMNADMRFVSESQNIFFLVNSPLNPQFVGTFNVPFWIVSGIDQVVNVRTLEGNESFHGTINLSLLFQPGVNVGLSLDCFRKFDFSKHCVTSIKCLSIEHGQGVSLSGHTKIHEFWVLLPENALV